MGRREERKWDCVFCCVSCTLFLFCYWLHTHGSLDKRHTQGWWGQADGLVLASANPRALTSPPSSKAINHPSTVCGSQTTPSAPPSAASRPTPRPAAAAAGRPRRRVADILMGRPRPGQRRAPTDPLQRRGTGLKRTATTHQRAQRLLLPGRGRARSASAAHGRDAHPRCRMAQSPVVEAAASSARASQQWRGAE